VPLAEEVGGTYVEGSVMEVRVAITAHHNGRFEFRICRILAPGEGQTWAQAEKAQMSQECFNQVCAMCGCCTHRLLVSSPCNPWLDAAAC